MLLKHPIRYLSAGFNHAGSRPVAQEIRLSPSASAASGQRHRDEGQLMRRPPSPAELAPLRPFGVTTWAQALIKWGISDLRVHVSLTAASQPGRHLSAW